MSISQILLLNAVLVSTCMFVLWLASLRLKNASIVDIFWGLGFAFIAIVTFTVGPGGMRSILLASLTTIWGTRLATYLFKRNHGKGEDFRYAAMREYRGESFWLVSLITVFAVQGIVMWMVSLPVQIGQFAPTPMTVLNFLGIGFWLVGFFFEAIGDFQLAKFKLTPGSRGRVLDTGLWRYTRHPNYFGNAMIWWGLFLIAATWSTVWLIISPVFMTFLLVKVSGVALLERNLLSRSDIYRDYVKRTSAFIPWPPKS